MNFVLLTPVIYAALNSLDPAVIYKYAKDAPPFQFTFIKALMALLVVVALMLLKGMGSHPVELLSVLIAVVSGTLGPCLGDAAYVRSIQLLGGSLAVVISFTYIFFAQAFSALILSEAVTHITVIGAVLAFAGVAVSSLRSRTRARSPLGILYALVAAVCWSLAIVLVKVVQASFDVLSLAFTRIASALLTAPVISASLGERWRFRKNYMVAAAVSGAVVWGIGMLLYIQSVFLLGVSTTVVAMALTPVLSQFTTRFVSGEKVSARVFTGALLVATGIALQVIQ